MSYERTVQLAQALLRRPSQPSGLIVEHSCQAARSMVDPKADQMEVSRSLHLLLEHGLVEQTSQPGSYMITALGVRHAEDLPVYLKAQEDVADAAHRANLATVKGVRNANITAWVAIGIAAASVVVSLFALFKQ